MRSRCMHVSKDCRVGCPGRTIISGGREGADVGEAREVMDRVTDAILRGDLEALKGLYAQDAVAETPDHGHDHRARPDRRLSGRVRHCVSGCRTGGAVPARGRRHGNRRRILRWDEHRLHDGAEPFPRPAKVCAFASATSRRSRMGLSRATVSSSTCRIGPRSLVLRSSPRRSLGGAVGVLGASAETRK